MSIQVTSEAFAAEEMIPSKFTADGQNVSPKLQWGELPAGTRELALIVDDPDAPREQPFVHWVMYKIPPDADGLPEHLPNQTQLDSPPGAVQGKNSFGKIGYGGPAPPSGHGTHHYHFQLYALDKPRCPGTFSIKGIWSGRTSVENSGEKDFESLRYPRRLSS